MPSNKMHYIITSITLGAIAASSALLISLTNLATRKQIDINEKNKINAGINEIFGENTEISKEYAIKDFKYTNYVYEVKREGESSEMFAFRTSGSNSYGKISLLVGFNYYQIPGGEEFEYVFSSISVIVNEQTYASTLVENYIDPVNDNKRNYEDVSCGATYGAKLIRDMINEAKEVTKTDFRKE